MKHSLLILLLFGLLFRPAPADEELRLSQEEAKQLHALLLAGELQDFGRRAESASALLMAAELLLDYPTTEQSRELVVALCRRARGFSSREEFVQLWAQRLEDRIQKSPRAPLLGFKREIGTLEAGEEVVIGGPYDGAWSTTPEVRIEKVGNDGGWRVSNPTEQTLRYEVILHQENSNAR